MAYGDFTLSKFKNNFNIHIDERIDLFADIEPVSKISYSFVVVV
jgi:hypothetical protein